MAVASSSRENSASSFLNYPWVWEGFQSFIYHHCLTSWVVSQLITCIAFWKWFTEQAGHGLPITNYKWPLCQSVTINSVQPPETNTRAPKEQLWRNGKGKTWKECSNRVWCNRHEDIDGCIYSLRVQSIASLLLLGSFEGRNCSLLW